MSSPFNRRPGTGPRPMTPNQRQTLRSMMLDKAELKGLDLQQADDKLDTWLAELTFDQASKHIGETIVWLKHARAAKKAAAASECDNVKAEDPNGVGDVIPERSQVTQADVPEVGVYEMAGHYYAIREFTNDAGDRIRFARRAMAVDKLGNEVAGYDENAHKVQFVRAPGAQYRIAEQLPRGAARRVPLAEVESLSLQFSQCLLCGRTLTVNASKAAGIGPVCRKKVG